MTENRKVLKAGIIISSGTFLSRIFGFIRDMVIAGMFGAGFATDAFFVAFKIPNLLRHLLGEGALSAAFIPLFTEYHTLKSEKDAWDFANAVISALALLLAVITVVGLIFMPWIVTVLAPGFRNSPGKFELTVYLTRITFPYLFFICLTATCMGILNSLRHFVVTAYSPVLLNLALIAAALWLSPYIEPPISGLAIGVMFGGVLQLSAHAIALKKSGMPFRFDFSLNHPGIKKVAFLMLPFVLGLGVTQINLFIDSLMASFLKEGAVSYLYYADRIVQFPLATFGIAFGTAILPSLSRLAAKNQLDEIRDTLSFGLRFTFFITIPAMVALAILAKPIITILFERGKFGAADSANTAGALVAYTIGLWAFSGIKILAPAYYSMKDTKTPVRIAIVAMLSNVVLNLILMRPLQHMGIALATSLSATINIALLIYYLEARVGRLDWHNVAVSLLRIIFAATIMGGACYLMLFTRDSYTMRMGQVLWLVMTMMIGLSTYLIASYLVKAEEMHFFIDVVVGRLKRKG